MERFCFVVGIKGEIPAKFFYIWKHLKLKNQEIAIKACEKAREFQKNIYFCFIVYAKALDCVDHKKLWKILKQMDYQTTWPGSWEICMQLKEQQLELDIEQ